MWGPGGAQPDYVGFKVPKSPPARRQRGRDATSQTCSLRDVRQARPTSPFAFSAARDLAEGGKGLENARRKQSGAQAWTRQGPYLKSPAAPNTLTCP